MKDVRFIQLLHRQRDERAPDPRFLFTATRPRISHAQNPDNSEKRRKAAQEARLKALPTI
jgi:hypothetical protein